MGRRATDFKARAWRVSNLLTEPAYAIVSPNQPMNDYFTLGELPRIGLRLGQSSAY